MILDLSTLSQRIREKVAEEVRKVVRQERDALLLVVESYHECSTKDEILAWANACSVFDKCCNTNAVLADRQDSALERALRDTQRLFHTLITTHKLKSSPTVSGIFENELDCQSDANVKLLAECSRSHYSTIRLANHSEEKKH